MNQTTAKSLKGVRIAFIDDDVSSTRAYRDWLDDAGAEIFYYDGLRDAHNALIGERSFDFVVMDLTMPSEGLINEAEEHRLARANALVLLRDFHERLKAQKIGLLILSNRGSFFDPGSEHSSILKSVFEELGIDMDSRNIEFYAKLALPAKKSPEIIFNMLQYCRSA